ncbi:TonB-system energizer ExbB [Helicobacter ailurogastricus]|uniref:Ferric siderophore transport system, biopolymer transport protein ExbB n=1 Tax=Helicobacter ailurogastricus TaxID=1578720 RepID=A0A0K2X7V5_9HELI|nr:TonB-system energizer ExbB [Helicobacter ailurogastricus]CRF40462.1 Ferric siderophore transport system, biopolymer transport protein ExbB [Helicobacter ailurogastricus]CRF43435.1 Ferric siderophore transport system, biopolymer transport protein ExbB [Helicobacter ailurogastricus]CRF43988.1 Ferric siderophore transport system, biopolymer transport protein ExbB [Helicobacter ailurogastricus]CRF52523.1 Ferric siderophore transport system, biopolymer transport protein ExbB [Helicobacter ailurog
MGDFNLKEMVDYGILGFLGFLSVIVIAIGIERVWFYATVRVDDYTDKRKLELDLHRRLTLVATIGSNAPYVGLLGTVTGIMITFIELGNTTGVDTKAIMVGLALALKSTGMGLIVAIPSVVIYNMLVRKSEIIATKWDIYHHPATADTNYNRLDTDL